MTSKPVFPIASRRSPLALAQAHMVRAMVVKAAGIAPDEVEARAPIRDYLTTGDQNLSGPLANIGGKGLFTKEVEAALLSGDARFAVHSLKDMPALSPPGLVIAAIPPREDPRDVFISPCAESPWDLDQGAVVGSASVRRAAQILRRRPDLKPVILRGNVGTRLAKLKAGDAAATFLALAGLKRLGLEAHATRIMAAAEMLPAPGQGALCIQARADDAPALALAAAFSCAQTTACVQVERAFLAGLDGSCRTPIAGLATIDAGELWFRGELLSLDGREHFVVERHVPYTAQLSDPACDDARAIGAGAAAQLRAMAGEAFFAQLAQGGAP